MKKNVISLVILSFVLVSMASFNVANRWVSNKTHIKFYSHTVAEDIEANNYKSVSTIDPVSGEVVFSVPMQGFEFEKALMQKHYNSDKFLDTKKYPKAKLVARITNLSEIHFDKDGTYPANIKGELTIKDKTNSITERGTITVKGKNVNVQSKFNITLAQYNVAFEKGKPSTNIGKSVEVSVQAEYVTE